MRNARPPGGSDVDLDQFVAVRRPRHEQADALYAASRHVVAPLGAGRFAFDVVRHPPKWDGVAVAPTQQQTGASAPMVLEGRKAELPSAVTAAVVGTSIRPYGENREA